MIAHNNFKLDKEMIYLIETLKVEAYWSRENFALRLQNKDIPLLNRVESIVKKLGMNVSKRILLKIRLDDNAKKEELDIYLGKRKLNFHIEKSPFDNKKIKAVTSLPHKNSYELLLKYKNKNISIKIKYLKNEIICESNLDCWVYGDISFPTKRLLEFLDKYCKGNKNLDIEETLFKSGPELTMSAFSALVDCEGTINWYGFKREIQIRMKAKTYLKKWADLLKINGVGNNFRKHADNWELVVSGWEDFAKLEDLGFRLHHSKKIKKWNEMMQGFKRNQISRNSYKKFYMSKLKEINKKITAQELADYINKSKRVANHYLLKLKKDGLISSNKTTRPYLYFISTSSVR